MTSLSSLRFIVLLGIAAALLTGQQQASAQPTARPLIVVADQGGASAKPFYEAIDVVERPSDQARAMGAPDARNPALIMPKPATDQDMLPVRSPTLSPGTVPWRTITSPLLTPIFLVGDDALSRNWLRQKFSLLQKIKATGFVVNVSTASALQALRQLAPGITLTPASGDDLGKRLEIQHYPVLITATTIQQ